MANIRLLQAVCTAALLAATPALAQNPSTTGAPNTAVQQPAPHSGSFMAPADNAGTAGAPDQSATSDNHSTHRSAMGHPAMHGRTDTSQNAAVDRLNDQSYQAAQGGRAFDAGSNPTPSGSTPSGSTPSGSTPSGPTLGTTDSSGHMKQ